MLRELVLAIGIPLVLLLLAVLVMEQWRDQLPAWLQRLAERPSWLWNTGIGLIIGLSLLRWLLQRRGSVTFRKGVTPGLPFRPPASTVAALVH